MPQVNDFSWLSLSVLEFMLLMILIVCLSSCNNLLFKLKFSTYYLTYSFFIL